MATMASPVSPHVWKIPLVIAFATATLATSTLATSTHLMKNSHLIALQALRTSPGVPVGPLQTAHRQVDTTMTTAKAENQPLSPYGGHTGGQATTVPTSESQTHRVFSLGPRCCSALGGLAFILYFLRKPPPTSWALASLDDPGDSDTRVVPVIELKRELKRERREARKAMLKLAEVMVEKVLSRTTQHYEEKLLEEKGKFAEFKAQTSAILCNRLVVELGLWEYYHTELAAKGKGSPFTLGKTLDHFVRSKMCHREWDQLGNSYLRLDDFYFQKEGEDFKKIVNHVGDPRRFADALQSKDFKNWLSRLHHEPSDLFSGTDTGMHIGGDPSWGLLVGAIVFALAKNRYLPYAVKIVHVVDGKLVVKYKLSKSGEVILCE